MSSDDLRLRQNFEIKFRLVVSSVEIGSGDQFISVVEGSAICEVVIRRARGRREVQLNISGRAVIAEDSNLIFCARLRLESDAPELVRVTIRIKNSLQIRKIGSGVHAESGVEIA